MRRASVRASERQAWARPIYARALALALSELEKLKSSGFTDLDEAARTGIEKCIFKPATRAGKPVESKLRMQYVWALE